MKILPTLLLLLVFGYSYCQDKPPVAGEDNARGFLIDVSGSADLCYRTLQGNASSFNPTVADGYHGSDKPKCGYTAGVDVTYKINQTFAVLAGVGFSDKGFLSETQPVSKSASPFVIDIMQFKYLYNFYYADIPVKFYVTAGKKKLRFIAGAGITTNILITTRGVNTILFNEEISSKSTSTGRSPYMAVDISPCVSAGIEYRLNKRVYLRVEPTFSYGALKITSAPVTACLWNTGLQASCLFALKK